MSVHRCKARKYSCSAAPSKFPHFLSFLNKSGAQNIAEMGRHLISPFSEENWSFTTPLFMAKTGYVTAFSWSPYVNWCAGGGVSAPLGDQASQMTHCVGEQKNKTGYATVFTDSVPSNGQIVLEYAFPVSLGHRRKRRQNKGKIGDHSDNCKLWREFMAQFPRKPAFKMRNTVIVTKTQCCFTQTLI